MTTCTIVGCSLEAMRSAPRCSVHFVAFFWLDPPAGAERLEYPLWTRADKGE